MNKRYLHLLFLVLFMIVIMPRSVLAVPNVILNGDRLSFDVTPLIENGRTLVPLRTIFESLGATVSWDENSQTVTAVKGLNTVNLHIGSLQANKNGQIVDLDVEAKIVNGRTLVPLRFVSEAMGCKVGWVEDTQTVVITDNSDFNSTILNYSDPKGRFAISYPDNWKISTDVPQIDLVIASDPKLSISNDFYANVNIVVVNIAGKNINMHMLKTDSLNYINNKFTDVKVLSEKEVLISGKSALELQISFTSGNNALLCKQIQVYNNDYLYVITVNTVLGENQELLDKLNSVANSIRIVDKQEQF